MPANVVGSMRSGREGTRRTMGAAGHGRRGGMDLSQGLVCAPRWQRISRQIWPRSRCAEDARELRGHRPSSRAAISTEKVYGASHLTERGSEEGIHGRSNYSLRKYGFKYKDQTSLCNGWLRQLGGVAGKGLEPTRELTSANAPRCSNSYICREGLDEIKSGQVALDKMNLFAVLPGVLSKAPHVVRRQDRSLSNPAATTQATNSRTGHLRGFLLHEQW